MTCSQLSRPPCSQAQQGFQWQQRGQVKICLPQRLQPTSVFLLDFVDLFCMLSFSCCCLTLMPTSSSPLCFCLFLFSLSLSLSFSSACIDPFTSAEAGDDSMPNLNPFLSKLVVDATHLPVVSSDGVSFSSRTSGHEMFGGNDSFCFSSKVLSLLLISL